MFQSFVFLIIGIIPSNYLYVLIKCFNNSARLFRGDFSTKKTNGIVEVYLPQKDPLQSPWFTICAETFTEKEAGKTHR